MNVESYQKIRDAFANHNPLMDTNVNQGQESEDIWIIHKHELEVWDKLSDLMAFCHESKKFPAVRFLMIAHAGSSYEDMTKTEVRDEIGDMDRRQIILCYIYVR